AACNNFFFYSVLGDGTVFDFGSFKVLHVVNRIYSRLHPVEYAERVKIITYFLSCCIREYKELGYVQDHTFQIFVNQTINQLILLFKGEKKFFLLDNSMHVQKIRLSEFLEDATMFCAFRDPRSNFRALNIESPSYTETVEKFVETIKKKQISFRKDIEFLEKEKISERNTRVVKVEFEQFVLNEKYRDSLAESVGLNLSNREKYSRFKPWESVCNTINYMQHPKQEEIRFIERELGEYCREIISVNYSDDIQ
ncbi:hypothetical protein LJC71_11335, partial [Desulfosarcina sp. OttesenSCG-928-A07]|nr:hypothetical protein [Desulfosarcina sp. OttesenSCG-928-G17]MDL2330310.1 hypothetical protein [Desulfosarcina sp. OttesenSCG-928-A07]